jgi:FkbM family methyltransferase
VNTKSATYGLIDRARRTPAINIPLTSLGRRLLPSGSLRCWCLEHLPRTGTVTIDLPYGAGNKQVVLQSGSDWLTSRIWWDGVTAFEPEVGPYFSALASQARCVLDIGAYTGWYSILTAVLNPTARVLAFEANPIVAESLRKNLELNSLESVEIVECAVSAEDGEAQFHLGAPGLPSSSSLEAEWKGLDRTITVQTRSIDSVMESCGRPHVDLVKIDIEGSEHRAINGMKETILRCQPVMVIELLKAHRSTFLDILPFLTDAGYEIYQCTPEALLHVEPTVEAVTRAQAINFLAVTRDNQFLPLLGLDSPLPRHP